MRNPLIISTGDGNRTRTSVSAHRILSPVIFGFIWLHMFQYNLIISYLKIVRFVKIFIKPPNVWQMFGMNPLHLFIKQITYGIGKYRFSKNPE
ncbi:hypothetical protein DYBT9275_03909 [Dyadobacter sp. CECT 9275]|uniref:Uncharacterized protein n=1 Tax=Dyadobacter helix TaxID=2822344 RepID=A0A916JIF0_9BACT|nr:hypothetical protein DYBT9275_03909 [Dyadobacter sp. CECT 9275]